ncbi:hypothetical protein EAI_15162 [Harpegnathos saltator]|uniref:Uncharacterized protein n=1 Tax=Harpegnathos saltator TaxID=610380 RepID=E2C713_HARSA|nr:hypothetical protein EAI_15162 [Harpegnathos saltator]
MYQDGWTDRDGLGRMAGWMDGCQRVTTSLSTTEYQRLQIQLINASLSNRLYTSFINARDNNTQKNAKESKQQAKSAPSITNTNRLLVIHSEQSQHNIFETGDLQGGQTQCRTSRAASSGSFQEQPEAAWSSREQPRDGQRKQDIGT